MAAMEDSFEATEKETIEAKEDVQVNDVPAHSLSDPLEDLRVGTQMRWLVGFIETDKGQRRSSISCGPCSIRESGASA